MPIQLQSKKSNKQGSAVKQAPSSFKLKPISGDNPALLETNARTAMELKKILTSVSEEMAKITKLFGRSKPGTATPDQLEGLKRLALLNLEVKSAYPLFRSILENSGKNTKIAGVARTLSSLSKLLAKRGFQLQAKFEVTTLPRSLEPLRGLKAPHKIFAFTPTTATIYLRSSSLKNKGRVLVVTFSQGKYYVTSLSEPRLFGAYSLGKVYSLDTLIPTLQRYLTKD